MFWTHRSSLQREVAMRPVRIIAAVVFAILTLLTVPAWAAPAAPVTLRVSPSSVAAGSSVTVSGSGGLGGLGMCQWRHPALQGLCPYPGLRWGAGGERGRPTGRFLQSNHHHPPL